MNPNKTIRIHIGAALTALFLIISFQVSTWTVLAMGDTKLTFWVKSVILVGLIPLTISMAKMMATGQTLAKAKSHPLLAVKIKRIKLMRRNGQFILMPAAIVLFVLAYLDMTSTRAYLLIQAIELAFGIANLTFLSLNLRDGKQMTRA